MKPVRSSSIGRPSGAQKERPTAGLTEGVASTVSTLVGKNIRPELLSLAHLPGLLAAANEARDSYRCTWVPESLAEMQRYVEKALTEHALGLSLPFATVLQASGQVIGSTRFMNIEQWPASLGGAPPSRSELPDGVEIGSTWLAASSQRTFANTEAKLLMLTCAFELWSVKRVTFKTDSRNLRSRAAIERLGAKFDGILRSHMRGSDGGARDSAFYSLLQNEWPAAKARLAERLREGISCFSTLNPSTQLGVSKASATNNTIHRFDGSPKSRRTG